MDKTILSSEYSLPEIRKLRCFSGKESCHALLKYSLKIVHIVVLVVVVVVVVVVDILVEDDIRNNILVLDIIINFFCGLNPYFSW